MNIWHTLPKPFFVLAPMEDVTDSCFRRIVKKAASPDLFFTEFTSTDGMCSPGLMKVAHRLVYYKEERPIIAQIWGTDPEKFFSSAKMIAERGFDGIDINIACPVKKITKQGACSAMIGKNDQVKEIIQATIEGGGLPVSVKTRLGIKESQVQEWCGFLLSTPITALTIHGRTVKEMSKVPAHWDEIAKVVDLKNQMKSPVLVVGNGDVVDRTDGEVKAKESGVDGIMIGRGIFNNLWAFETQPKNHTSEERIAFFTEHIKLYQSEWKGEKNFQPLKKFVKTYVHGFDGAAELREELVNAKNADELLSTLVHSTTSSS